MKIVECVPNFSEGRDLAKIKQITDEIEKIDGIQLLDVDPGADTNRTVVTFVGEPEKVMEAAFAAVKKASEVIDMRLHKGAHARFGATDVVPFVPVSNITMEECAEMARKVGRRIGEELEIPVYLYEEAASKPEWKNLAVVRSGEYEGLEEKLQKPEWKPDFGPAKFNAKSGATAVSAREFLIAWNINLNTTEKKYAFDLAFDIRYKGRSKRVGNTDPYYYRGRILRYKEGSYPCGPCDYVAPNLDDLRNHYKNEHNLDLDEEFRFFEQDPNDIVGKPVKVHGKYDHVKSVGWYIDEYKRAQITINFTNYKKTPPHLVVEEARQLAYKMGVIVTGNELVGLIPYDALRQAGEYYLEKQDRSRAIPWKDVIETAVQSLNLTDVCSFDIGKDVLGTPPKPGPLASMTLADFADEVSRESVAPGGGSIAAYAGAIGAALGNMVANITLTKFEKTYMPHHQRLHELALEAQKIKDELVYQVDRDTDAFNDVMEANRLPKGTKEEAKIREEAIQEGYKKATMVPFRTAELSLRAAEICKEIAEKGNKNSVTDAGVGAVVAEGGVIGGAMNVLINMPNITDESFKGDLKKRLDDMQRRAKEIKEETQSHVMKIIAGM